MAHAAGGESERGQPGDVGALEGDPKVRLPGAGGAPEIAANAGDVIVVARQTPRAFVDRCDFITSTGQRLRTVITDLGILRKMGAELVLTATHPGVVADDVRQKTGWALQVADVLDTTADPTAEELSALRSLTAT